MQTSTSVSWSERTRELLDGFDLPIRSEVDGTAEKWVKQLASLSDHAVNALPEVLELLDSAKRMFECEDGMLATESPLFGMPLAEYRLNMRERAERHAINLRAAVAALESQQ